MSRGPLEVIAFALAVYPALMVLDVWNSLPRRIPIRFSISGEPDRWGGREQSWILPIIAFLAYCLMSAATGTWSWVLDSQAKMPAGAGIVLVFKPLVGFLMIRATAVLVRIARNQEEPLNSFMLWSLMALLVAPPVALTMAIH